MTKIGRNGGIIARKERSMGGNIRGAAAETENVTSPRDRFQADVNWLIAMGFLPSGTQASGDGTVRMPSGERVRLLAPDQVDPLNGKY